MTSKKPRLPALLETPRPGFLESAGGRVVATLPKTGRRAGTDMLRPGRPRADDALGRLALAYLLTQNDPSAQDWLRPFSKSSATYPHSTGSLASHP